MNWPNDWLPPKAHLVSLQSNGNPEGRVREAAFEWSWNSCDGAYLWWFWKRQERGMPSFDWYWFMEWDLAWTGNLPRMLASFHSPGTSQPDLLGHAIVGTTRSYPHKLKLNRSVFNTPVNSTHWCSQQLMKMSHRLLLQVMQFVSSPSNYMFCELRTPTVCARATNCTMQPIQSVIPSYFGDGSRLRRDWNKGGFSNSELQRLPRSYLANNSLPDRFYHRYKHDAYSFMESATPSGRAMPSEASGVAPAMKG